MTVIKRDVVIDEALKLLDEIGLDEVSMRKIAQRLGVESASLYWHFKNKAELLDEMAAAVIARHHRLALPESVDLWRDFVAANTRSFRNALLAHRDGARLHAGSRPPASEMVQILSKVAYLVRAGFSEHVAGMALFSTSQFTIGCVLEEQANLSQQVTDGIHAEDTMSALNAALPTGVEVSINANEAFEFGLTLLVQGLEAQLTGHRASTG